MNVRTSKILVDCGFWQVTSYGIESTQHYYPIERTRLWEPDWVQHLSGKVWCQGGRLTDFREALRRGREIHAKYAPKPGRRAVA